MTALKHHDSISHEELDNLRTNIYKKMAQLNVKLPKLAELIGIPHASLWRITNEGFQPNFQSLYPIAKFFGVTVADLLKSPDLPQYVPILDLSDLNKFFIGDLDIEHNDTILSNEYIHENAFALVLQFEQYGLNVNSTFLFKPFHKLHIGNIGIIEVKNKYRVVKVDDVIEENKFDVQDILSKQNLLLEDARPIAIAVKQIVDNNLL